MNKLDRYRTGAFQKVLGVIKDMPAEDKEQMEVKCELFNLFSGIMQNYCSAKSKEFDSIGNDAAVQDALDEIRY